MRIYLEGEDNVSSGEYRWDFLDGYQDGGSGGLDGHPEEQAKVRRVVTQGFIDPEDFKGVSVPPLYFGILLCATLCLRVLT